MNQTLAQIKVLEYKLDAIREHIERRLSVVEGETNAELTYILGMISRYESVPASWSLQKPLVERKGENSAEAN